MLWRNLQQWRALAWPARLAVVLAAAGLTAGCWQPLYGARPAGGEGVQDKFAAVDIPPVSAPKGTPTERVAVGMRNALQFDLHNGGSPMPPAYALKVNVAATQYTAYVDPTTGRPDTQIQYVTASYQLVELATDKIVVSDSTIRLCRLRHPGLTAAFRRSACPARRRRSRSPGGRRHDPQPAGLILRGRDVASPLIPWNATRTNCHFGGHRPWFVCSVPRELTGPISTFAR